jgi:L-2-hydroxyglutarate oxidase
VSTGVEDVVVVGGGIVGLATAHALLAARPGLRLQLVEKESALARHQTGRNSGVIHSGVYYKPGSLKARTVAAGRQALLRLCVEEGIAHDVCGKVIVATQPIELPELSRLRQRGQANGVRVERIDPSRLRELEPHATGIAALHVPDAAIVDFPAVCDALARRIAAAGGTITTEWEVGAIDERRDAVVVRGPAGDIEARSAVNCGGLHADELAGSPDDVRILPFRGEYYELKPSAAPLVRNMIYPVPDPAFPFLGVHFTRGVHGGVHAGPNAVLALAREGYRWGEIDRAELRAIAGFRGTRRLARRYWRTGVAELYRSWSRGAFTRALRRLVPEVSAADLVRSPAGVRAQAVDRDGRLLDDFELRETARVVHVLNAPSPAATASIEIGRLIAERLHAHLAS